MSGSLLVAWLVGLPLCSAPLVYLAGRLGRASAAPSRPLAAQGTALAALGLTWSVWLMAERDSASGDAASVWLGAAGLRLDGLSLFVGAMALALGVLVVAFCGADIRGQHNEEKFYALLLVEIGAVIAVASATDLFNLWVWFEVMAVTSYVLVAFFSQERASLEAGVKYLVQSVIGSTLALLGVALVLAHTGTLDLNALRASATPSSVLLAAGALLLAGFGTKAGLVPFHAWLPDVYSQAPSGVSALLSGLVTKLGLVAALRALGALASVSPSWALALIGFGVLGMIFGNLLAFRQRQLKRLLACSSLAHLGYALLGIGIGLYAGQPASAEGGVFHLLTHGLMSTAAFLAAGALLYGLRQERRGGAHLSLSDLDGAAGRYPLVTLALSLAVLGLAGLPPLAGFMSEWQIYTAGFGTRSSAIIAIVLLAVLNTVLSLAYYAPVVAAAYRQRPSDLVLGGRPVPTSMTIPLLVLSLGIVALGVLPGLASGLVRPAATALIGAFAQ